MHLFLNSEIEKAKKLARKKERKKRKEGQKREREGRGWEEGGWKVRACLWFQSVEVNEHLELGVVIKNISVNIQ